MGSEDVETQVDATSEMADIEQPKPKRAGKHKSVSEVPENIPDEGAAQAKADAAEKSKRESAERKTRESKEKDAEKQRAAEERREAAERERMAKQEEKHEKIHKVKEQENAVFSALAKRIEDEKGLLALRSDAYTELDANVEMAIRGLSYGFIACGRGGVGKTYRILQTCIKECKKENVAYTDSYTTAGGFAVWLYTNRMKEVIVLDDVAGLLKNDKIVSMLKGALWHGSDGKTRVVNYMTTKPLQDEYGEPVPSMFEIDARIIIITNDVDDDNPHIKAILSRVNLVRVDIPYSELLLLLQQIIDKNEHKGLTKAERQESFTFMREKTSKKTENLNIRSLLRIMDYRAYAKVINGGELWKVLSSKLLQQNDRLLLVEKLMSEASYSSEEERIEKFIELTGESRPTWYRWKAKVKKMLDERAEDVARAEAQHPAKK